MAKSKSVEIYDTSELKTGDLDVGSFRARVKGPEKSLWTYIAVGGREDELHFRPPFSKPGDTHAIIHLEEHHNCTCHKLACISFFDLKPGKGYRQVPLWRNHPDSRFIVLGQVEERELFNFKPYPLDAKESDEEKQETAVKI